MSSAVIAQSGGPTAVINASFVGCVEGMAQACEALAFPVVSGNVSLYNETDGRAIPPTPAVGAVGLIGDVKTRAGYGGLAEGDVLLVIGDTQGHLGSSLFLRETLGREDGPAPRVDLGAEKRNGDFVRAEIRAGRARKVHDVSEAGIAGAVADMAMAAGIGAKLAHTGDPPLHAWLFGEDQARYLIAADEATAEIIRQNALEAGVPVEVAGIAGGTEITVNGGHGLDVARLKRANAAWLPDYMAGGEVMAAE